MNCGASLTTVPARPAGERTRLRTAGVPAARADEAIQPRLLFVRRHALLLVERGLRGGGGGEHAVEHGLHRDARRLALLVVRPEHPHVRARRAAMARGASSPRAAPPLRDE